MIMLPGVVLPDKLRLPPKILPVPLMTPLPNNKLPGRVKLPEASKSHRLGPPPPFCPTAILTIFDPEVGLAYTAAMLLVPTLPISSTQTDDTAPLAPDDIASNGRSSAGCINAASMPNTLVLPAITRLPGKFKLPVESKVQVFAVPILAWI